MQVNKRQSFPSLSDHHGKLQSRRACNSGLPICRKSIRQCLAQWTQVQNLPAWSAHQALRFSCWKSHTGQIEGFLSPKVHPKAGVPQGCKLSSLFFLIYVNDMPNPSHHQTNKSQFADDTSQWAVSKNIDLAAKYLQRDLDKLAR